MSNRKILTNSLITIGIVGALGVSGAAAANAAAPTENPTPNSECSGSGPDIAVSSVTDVYIPGTFRAYGDGGAVLQIQAGQSSTVSSDVSVSGTLTAEAVVASASVTAGVTLGTSETVSQGASGSYTVPAGLNGQYIELGADGRSFNWSATTYNSGCVVTSSQSGSSTAPTDNPWFHRSW